MGAGCASLPPPSPTPLVSLIGHMCAQMLRALKLLRKETKRQLTAGGGSVGDEELLAHMAQVMETSRAPRSRAGAPLSLLAVPRANVPSSAACGASRTPARNGGGAKWRAFTTASPPPHPTHVPSTAEASIPVPAIPDAPHARVCEPGAASAVYRVMASRRLTGSSTAITRRATKPKGAAAATTAGKGDRHRLLNITKPSDVELAVGKDKPRVGFTSGTYSVIEGGGSITVQVERTGPTNAPLTVAYRTEDLTATAGSDYVAMSDVLTLAAGERAAQIMVKIIDDDVIEDDEHFLIRLTTVTAGEAVLGPLDSTKVTIVNDDFPGTLVFSTEEITVREDCGHASLLVRRLGGCSGAVSLRYRTIDGTGLAGHNYTATSGELTWAHQDVGTKAIEIPITDDNTAQGKQYFEVEIADATGGAKFDPHTDGSTERSLARVTIEDDENITGLADRAMAFLSLDLQATRLGTASWANQFRAALLVGGQDDDDASTATPGIGAWTAHLLSLPWKLLVACIPPTSFCGGKLCFVVAIVLIGGRPPRRSHRVHVHACTHVDACKRTRMHTWTHAHMHMHVHS